MRRAKPGDLPHSRAIPVENLVREAAPKQEELCSWPNLLHSSLDKTG
jgi:hypothetical protein